MKKGLLCLLLIIGISFSLQAEAFRIGDYDVVIDVQEDGSFRVRETIAVRFSEERHGIIRSLPYRYLVEDLPGESAIRSTTKEGYYETLLKDVKVLNHPFQTSKEGNYIKIRIGSPSRKVRGKQVYEIEYTVYGAINQFAEHQEFSWNLTGNEWDTSIEEVSFKINFPRKTMVNKSDVICYTGRQGTKGQEVTWNISESQVVGKTTRRLKSRAGVSLAIRFPVDYFSRTEIPLTAYAQKYYVKNHHAVFTVKNNTAVEVLETYDIAFLKPTNAIHRFFPIFARELPNGGNQNTVIAEEELLAETEPAQPLTLVVNRKRNMDYISIMAKEKAFNGNVRFQLRYQLWGTAIRRGDESNFAFEVAHLATEEPIENSSFEIQVPENIKIAGEGSTASFFTNRKEKLVEFSRTEDQRTLTGKIKQALVHNPTYQVYFTTDAENLDFTAAPMEVYSQYYYMDYFKTDIYLQKDGTARIEYGLEPEFVYDNTNEEFQPYVRKRYAKSLYELPNYGLLAKDYKPLISDIINPNPEKYRLVKKKDRSYFQLRNPNRDEWDQPFTYSYKIDGIQTTQDGLYKINFPVIYPEEEPVRGGSFRVHFPDEINPEEVTVSAQTSEGRTVGRINKEGKVITGIVDETLLPGEAVVLTLLYPKSYTGWKLGAWLKLLITNNVFFIIAFLGLALLTLLWYFLGRDEQHPLEARFRPPADITSAEAGLLWDGKLHQKDLISLIYYWASHGFLKIREENVGHITNHILIKKADLPANAKSFERTMFNGLFASGTEVSVNSLRNSFYKTLKKAHVELEEHGKQTGFYVKGSRGLGIVLISLGVVGLGGSLVLLGFSFFSHDFSISIPLLLLALATIFFGYYMPKKAPFGAERFSEILGFREFIKTAEIDRLRTLATEDPKYFEGTIAYAIVFGLGREWAKKFADLSLESPDWYEGTSTSTFHPIFFTNNMMSSMNSINADLTYVKPAPSTSSGSGGSSFGGGFSSGGGFGGGGGSSW